MVLIVVPTMNPDLAENCLAAISASGCARPYRIVVIDNCGLSTTFRSAVDLLITYVKPATKVGFLSNI